MVTFIEADAAKYAELAKENRRHLMVHREDDGTLTCEVDGVVIRAETAWQLDSRLQDGGVVGVSLWLDSVFSAPGVMLESEGT
jgi:hypothetical protein